MQEIAGQKHEQCRETCSSLCHHHIQIRSSHNFQPVVQWLTPLAVGSRAVEVGLLSDTGMEGQIPQSCCVRALTAPCTVQFQLLKFSQHLGREHPQVTPFWPGAVLQSLPVDLMAIGTEQRDDNRCPY